MWRDFYQLNKEKLLQLPLALWIIIAVAILLASQLFHGGGEKVSLQEGIEIALISATAITAMAVAVSLLSGLYYFYKKRKIFSQQNWRDFFKEASFVTTLIHKNSKLHFTEEIQTGLIDGIPVIANIMKEEPTFIEFQFYVRSEPIGKQEYKVLEKLFKEYNAGFEIGYISKRVHKHSAASEISSSLKAFSLLLYTEKFRPFNSEKDRF